MNIKKFYDFLNEDGSTCASPGSGTAVGGGAQGSFVSSAGQAVYGGSSGTAFATNSNTSGMGPVVAAQPSSTPGSVWGADSKSGSGDVGTVAGTYTKQPANIYKRKKKDKSQRKNYKKGQTIDTMYVTNYREKYTKDNKLITSWTKFNEIYKSEE